MKIGNIRWTKWLECVGVILLTFHLSLFASCSEENDEEEEFANWQERNESTTDQWATRTNGSWYRKIVTYSKDASATDLKNSDYIYVEELARGEGTESPAYTDTVRVAYRGRLIPSKSYKDGYVFDQTFLNDFDWQTTDMTDFNVSGTVTGFATALMNMHPGDYWRVYIPYQLGYGTTSSDAIPGYSNLIFDIVMDSFWHPGDEVGTFKSR